MDSMSTIIFYVGIAVFLGIILAIVIGAVPWSTLFGLALLRVWDEITDMLAFGKRRRKG